MELTFGYAGLAGAILITCDMACTRQLSKEGNLPVCPSSAQNRRQAFMECLCAAIIGKQLKCDKGGAPNSLQLQVLSLGLFQGVDLRVGIFPECKEIFAGGERRDASGGGRAGH